MRRTLLVALAAATALTLGGCGANGGNGDSTTPNQHDTVGPPPASLVPTPSGTYTNRGDAGGTSPSGSSSG